MERLRGGKADGIPESRFDAARLAEGKRHEAEHTDDPEVASEIARDHLVEDPAYYAKLEAVEKGGVDYGDWSLLAPGQEHDFVVQKHRAERAGAHYDLRLGSPETGLYSWATRKELPPPGGLIGVFRQPVHDHAYAAFEGEIAAGYGKGTVARHSAARVKVRKVTPTSVHLETIEEHPRRLALTRGRDDRTWLLIHAGKEATASWHGFARGPARLGRGGSPRYSLRSPRGEGPADPEVPPDGGTDDFRTAAPATPDPRRADGLASGLLPPPADALGPDPADLPDALAADGGEAAGRDGDPPGGGWAARRHAASPRGVVVGGGGVLTALRAAKAHSDRRDYARKHRLLRQLLAERPGEFVVDSRMAGIVGLTHRSGFRIHAPAAVLPPGFPKRASLLPGPPMAPEQAEVVDTGHDRSSRVLVYHTLGSGKTRTALSAAEAAGDPATFVVPASLRPNLAKERARWTDGTLPTSVVSYDALARGNAPAAGTVVFDEAQRLRNPGGAAARRARVLARRARHLYLLSGTPIVNHPHDLAPLISMLTDRDMSPEQFDAAFLDERKVSPGFLGWLRGIKPATEPVMKDRRGFRDLMRGHVSYYEPAAPEVTSTEEHHVAEMSPEQARLYRGFWGQLPFALRWKMQRQFPLSRAELRRLNSFLGGPRQVGLSTLPFMGAKADPLKAYEQSPKLQMAVRLMTDALAKDPAYRGVAYSNFVDAGLTPYAAALEARGIPHGVFHGGLDDRARKKVVDDYNAGRTRVLLLGPAASEGISLKGTRLLQVLDPHWNSARTAQAIGRGIRFDSHADLPPEQRRVVVQRFASRLPRSTLQRLWRAFRRTPEDPRRDGPGVDAFLEGLNRRKDRLNEQFLGELRAAGREGRSRGWFR